MFASLNRGDLTAEWESIGEGFSGDYNPDDPNDAPLLRFSVLLNGEQIDDGSYCTLMPEGSDPAILLRGLELILDAAESSSPKRRLEELSWMRPEDFTLNTAMQVIASQGTTNPKTGGS